MPFIDWGTGWLLGVALAAALQPSAAWLLLAAVPLLGLGLWRTDRRARRLWLGGLAVFIGGVRYSTAQPHFDAASLATYHGAGQVTVEGVIVADPELRDTYLNVRVAAERLTLPDGSTRPVAGLLLARPARPQTVRYGDRVRVTGLLTAPPEFATFDYADFLARQGVYALIDRPRLSVTAHDQGSPVLAALYTLRRQAADTIARLLPEPQAALLTGILLGNDSGLPPDVQAAFRATGTSHIIAISG